MLYVYNNGVCASERVRRWTDGGHQSLLRGVNDVTGKAHIIRLFFFFSISFSPSADYKHTLTRHTCTFRYNTRHGFFSSIPRDSILDEPLSSPVGRRCDSFRSHLRRPRVPVIVWTLLNSFRFAHTNTDERTRIITTLYRTQPIYNTKGKRKRPTRVVYAVPTPHPQVDCTHERRGEIFFISSRKPFGGQGDIILCKQCTTTRISDRRQTRLSNISFALGVRCMCVCAAVWRRSHHISCDPYV